MAKMVKYRILRENKSLLEYFPHITKDEVTE